MLKLLYNYVLTGLSAENTTEMYIESDDAYYRVDVSDVHLDKMHYAPTVSCEEELHVEAESVEKFDRKT